MKGRVNPRIILFALQMIIWAEVKVFIKMYDKTVMFYLLGAEFSSEPKTLSFFTLPLGLNINVGMVVFYVLFFFFFLQCLVFHWVFSN